MANGLEELAVPLARVLLIRLAGLTTPLFHGAVAFAFQPPLILGIKRGALIGCRPTFAPVGLAARLHVYGTVKLHDGFSFIRLRFIGPDRDECASAPDRLGIDRSVLFRDPIIYQRADDAPGDGAAGRTGNCRCENT